jgi:hypothetical protein
VKKPAAKKKTAKTPAPARHAPAHKGVMQESNGPNLAPVFHPPKPAAKKPGAKKPTAHKKAVKWTPGGVACCGVEALAASARLAGHDVTPAAVLDLYEALTDGDDAGMPLEDALRGVLEHGIGRARLTAYRPATVARPGVVAGLDLDERHAVTLGRGGVWSWGDLWSVPAAFYRRVDEAWELIWA